ncbi:MAG: tetratricopeptide repeat protein [Deltaproteobacteria bacterium]|nr:tetratricopeptide repeat protein [Deltaproteobacteria bacterium]MBL7217177.1 tetratricopeptide repeat protein [Desulfobacteraceae bacterium]
MKIGMSVLLLVIFLAILALPYTDSAFGQDDPAASGGETLDSEDDGDPDPSGSTPDNVANKELELPKLKHHIVFDPLKYKVLANKEMGHNQTISILNFPDKREGRKGMAIGGLYDMVYHTPRVNLRSEQPVSLAIMSVMETLFEANGFQVNKFPSVSEPSEIDDGTFVVTGQINKFWVKIFHSMEAWVDIDVKIIDRKLGKTIWTGKIQSTQVKGPNVNAGVILSGTLGDEKEMPPFLDEVLGNAIRKAWTEQGMRNALAGNMKKQAVRKVKHEAQKRVVQKKPDPPPKTVPGPNDAKANFKVGLGHYDLGEFNEAIKSFKQAIALKPGWARAHYRLGLAYFKTNDKESAVEQYEILKDLDGNYAKILFNSIYKDD